MSSNNILADKDINAPTNIEIHNKDGGKGDVKSMEYHRQILQSKLDEGQGKQTYVSPSDTLMSPCTAKITALRTKQIGIKAKPRSLFAKTSAKNLGAQGAMFGPIPKESSQGEDTNMDGQ